MSDQAKKKMLEEIRKDLFSHDDEVLTAALKKLQSHGDGSFVAPLIQVYHDREDDKLREDIATMLGTLKVSGTETAFIEALEDQRKKAIHKDLLNFMWNSGINVPHRLGLIVKVSLQGDFMQCFEGLTLLESMEGPFSEEQVNEAMIELRRFLGDSPAPDVKDLAEQMYRIVTEIEDQV